MVRRMGLSLKFVPSIARYFEFRICDNVQAKQDCLDKHLMRIVSGTPSIPHPNDLKTRFYPRNGSRIYDMKAELPAGMWLSSAHIHNAFSFKRFPSFHQI